jgi:hypothetical protein
MMMRLPYLHTPIDFVPEDLRREEDLDLAEAIFGYTKSRGEGKARAYASRVFVGDALLEPGQSNIWWSDEADCAQNPGQSQADDLPALFDPAHA